MHVIRHAEQALVEWRPGVKTRLWAAAGAGARALMVMEQVCQAGLGAPTHYHHEEEHLVVYAGRAEVWIGDERQVVTAGATVIVPPRAPHGFSAASDEPLHVIAILASPTFEAIYAADPPGIARRAFDASGDGPPRQVAGLDQ